MPFKNQLVLIVFVSIITIACKYDENNKNDDNSKCEYRLNQIAKNDSVQLIFDYQDSIIEVKDRSIDTSTFGLYRFDKSRNLRFYGFFVNGDHYRYSESYDLKGNLIEKEGTPLLQYTMWKKQNDTILFNCILFSLNKKYNGIQIISNLKDTISPKYLYKCPIYSNTKCFAFKLPVGKDIQNLTLFAKVNYINTCTGLQTSFDDTTSFANTKLGE